MSIPTYTPPRPGTPEWDALHVTPDTYLNGRPVLVEVVEYHGVDSFVSDASWADTLEPLTDDEMGELHEYAYERAVEHYGYGPK